MSKESLQQGPFKDVKVKTIEITPIKITITESRDSTHVPPQECGCGGGGLPMDVIMQAVRMASGAASPDPVAVDADEPSDGVG